MDENKYVVVRGYYDTNTNDGDSVIIAIFDNNLDAEYMFTSDAADILADYAFSFSKNDRINRNVYIAMSTLAEYENCNDTMFYKEMPATAITECEEAWEDRKNADHWGTVAVSISWIDGIEGDVNWYDNLYNMCLSFAHAWINDWTEDWNTPYLRVWEYADEENPYPVWIDPVDGRKMTTEY